MERVYIGSKRISNIFLGNKKVLKIYLGNQCVYGGGEVNVVYHVEGVSLHADKTLYEGDDALKLNYASDLRDDSGTIINPSTYKSGWTLAGWRTDANPSSEVFNKYIISGIGTVHLYAVYTQTKRVDFYSPVYDTSKTPTYSYTNVDVYCNQGTKLGGSCKLDLPTVSNLSKIGWSTSALTVRVDRGPDATVTGILNDVTFYGIYAKSVTLAALRYNGNNTYLHENSYYVCNTTKCQQNSCSFTIPEYSTNAPDGWYKVETKGWVTKTDSTWSTSTRYTPKDTVTLYNDLFIYQIYYASNDLREYKSEVGTKYNDQFGTKYYIPSAPSTFYPAYKVTDASRSGWDWLGYSYTNDTNMNVHIVKDSTIQPTSPIGIYAIFSQKLTLNLYNGSATASSITDTKYLKIRSETSNPNNTYITEVNPTVRISEANIDGWEKVGWTTIDDVDATVVYNSDSDVQITNNNTYLYSKYCRNLKITFGDTKSYLVYPYLPITQYGLFGDWGGLWTNRPSVDIAGRDFTENGILWTVKGWNTDGTHKITYDVSMTVGDEKSGKPTVGGDTKFYTVFTTPYNKYFKYTNTSNVQKTWTISDGTDMYLCNGSYSSKEYAFPKHNDLPSAKTGMFLYWSHGGGKYYAGEKKTITSADFTATAVYLTGNDIPKQYNNKGLIPSVSILPTNPNEVRSTNAFVYASPSQTNQIISDLIGRTVSITGRITVNNLPQNGMLQVTMVYYDYDGSTETLNTQNQITVNKDGQFEIPLTVNLHTLRSRVRIVVRSMNPSVTATHNCEVALTELITNSVAEKVV